jgi:hypothetical protein
MVDTEQQPETEIDAKKPPKAPAFTFNIGPGFGDSNNPSVGGGLVDAANVPPSSPQA